MSLTPLWEKIKEYGRWLLLLLVFFLCVGSFGLGDHLRSRSDEERLAQLLADNTELHVEITETKVRYQRADQALTDLTDEHTDLVDLYKKLQTKASQTPIVKEVIVTRTVIQPVDRMVTVTDMPDSYVHKLHGSNGDLQIASYEHTDEGHVFRTEELEFRVNAVVGEDKAAALLQVASSANSDDYVEFPIDDFVVKKTDPDLKLFKPDLHLALRAGLSDDPQLTVSLGLTLLHPTKCIDTLGINVSGNSQTAQLGIIPFAYNIGCHIPVVDDLWIVTDAYVGFSPRANQPLGINYGAGLGIGTKF